MSWFAHYIIIQQLPISDSFREKMSFYAVNTLSLCIYSIYNYFESASQLGFFLLADPVYCVGLIMRLLSKRSR